MHPIFPLDNQQIIWTGRPPREKGKIFQKPFVFDWQITELQSLSCCSGEYYFSPAFDCHGGTWNLVIYPHGKDELAGFISLFLKMKTGDLNDVKYQICLKDKRGNVYLSRNKQHVYRQGDQSGWTELFKSLDRFDKKERAALNDILTVSCSIAQNICDDELSQTNPQYYVDASKRKAQEPFNGNYKQLYLNYVLSDIKIKAKEQTFFAHKSVLTIRSKYFRNMFEHNPRKVPWKRQDDKDEIEIPGTEPDIVRQFLYCLYHKHLETLNSGNVYELYNLSKKYEVDDLYDECVIFMEDNLSAENLFTVFRHACGDKDYPVLKYVMSFAAKHAKRIFLSDEWKELRTENCSLVTEILEEIILQNKAFLSAC